MIKMMEKVLKVLSVISILNTGYLTAQQIDIGSIGRGTPFKLSGNVAANSVFYNSSQNEARSPFTYFLQGSLNFSVYEFSIPVSYSFSNQGESLEYQLPFTFNRLSFHPKYKWVQAHIGDVTMSFSPYTLAGHQFSGGGVELTPKGGFTFSAMYGRLLKAVEDDENNRTEPAFKRNGYGAKVGYQGEKYSVELIGFYAKDEINSIRMIPEEKQVLPKENLVLSMAGSVSVMEGLQIKGEYASTAITQDLRADTLDNTGGVAGILFENRGSTEHYNAFKTEMEYTFDKYRFGVGYERIDPGYQTLGGYFFNNDFENITLNGTTSIFQNKLNLSFNVGYQRDDLANQKETKTNRSIGSINATYAMSKKVNISGGYSNFTTFTNNRLDQFENINDDNLIDNQNELFDFKQLSQNANLNVSYIIENSKVKRQNLNINYSLATVANEEDGIVRIGGESTFHNFNTSYTIGLPNKKMNITSALSTTYNTIGREDSYTLGPTVSVSKKFLKDKLNTTFSSSYNQSTGKINNTKSTNLRFNANYIYKEKHNFNLNAIQLFRSSITQSSQDLTITFGYNYGFDLSGKKEKRRKKIKEKNSEISYEDYKFEGSPSKISTEILALENTSEFKELYKISEIKKELSITRKEMIDAELKSKKNYKEKALKHLKNLNRNRKFLDRYYNLSFIALKRLYRDAINIKSNIDGKYSRAKRNYEESINKEEKIKYYKKIESAYILNNFILEKLERIEVEDLKKEEGILYEHKNKYLSTIFKLLKEEKTENEISIFLQISLTKIYQKKSSM